MRIASFVFVVLAVASTVIGATVEAPVDVRAKAEGAFATKPAVVRDGDKVKVSFEVAAATDAEVAVLDAKGRIVRHLAAGLLGKNAPEPFRKNSLKQELVWDGKDDTGRPAAGGPFKVRVRLGAEPKLEKYVGWDGNTLGGAIVGLAVGKDGELFVLLSDAFRGRAQMRVFSRDGKYLRTIMPYPASTPKERTASVGHLEIEGERLPIVFNGLGHTTTPLASGFKRQTMAWHPKGYLVLASATGTMAEHGPPRHILAMHPEGGAPDGVPHVGPRFRKGTDRSLGGDGEASTDFFDQLAVSPDGQHVFLTTWSNSRRFKQSHGVFRAKWTDKELAEPWLGKTAPGADDEHLNDPQGVATDKTGRIYVCDRGNNRVMVFSPQGKLLGKFAVENPEQIAVHPVSGEIYIACKKKMADRSERGEPARLLKFSAWGAGVPKELARLDGQVISVMALDASASPPRLWIAGRGLLPLTDRGAQFEVGAPVGSPKGLNYPMFVAGDPERNRALVYEGAQVMQVDLNSGAKSPFIRRGTAMALDRDGNVYVMDGYGTNSISRYDPSGNPLAFPALGTNKIMTKGYRGYGPSLGLMGIAVGAGGDIYVIRSSNYGGPQSYGGRVDVFGPDGNPKTESIIEGMGYGDCGLGVDAAGNIYVGVNIKPADKPFPPAFMGKVPGRSWTWWRGAEREVPWCYTYYNPYLWHWGSVMKFPPGGGTFYGQHPWLLKDPKYANYGPPKPSDSLENAPADATSFRSACFGYEVKVSGALWRYAGCGIVPSSGDALKPDPGCVCYHSLLAVDPFGRVFAPNVFRFSVEMLDTNGNQIARIGRYGNPDSAGPGSREPEPEIAFVWPVFVSASGGKVFVSDSVNRRIVVVRFDYAAEETCDVR